MKKNLFLSVLVCLFTILSYHIKAQTPPASGAVAALAQTAQDITSVPRDVYNMSAEQGQLLLTSGRLLASPPAGNDDAGAPGANCPQGQAQTASSGSGSGAAETPHSLMIELRLHAVNGFNGFNGERVPYSESSFDSTIDSLISKHRRRLNQLSVSDAKQWLLDHTYLDDSQSAAITDSLWKDRIVSATPGDRIGIYQEMGRTLAFDDQIRFIAKLGGAMSDNYDHDRAARVTGANTVTQCDDILTGLASTTPQGVCRDIAICQATVLYHMGNRDNVYAASFPVPGNYHVTLMVTDPHNRSRVHKISYNNVATESNLEGSAAIHQDQSPDVGTMVRVWRPTEREDGSIDGQFAGVIPTEVGLLLEEETSPNPNDVTGSGRFDPFTRRSYSVLHAGGSYGPVAGRIFAAKLSNGDVVYGAGVNANWGSLPEGNAVYNGLDNRGHVGIAYAHRDTEVRVMNSDGTVSTEPWNLNMIYLSVHQRVAAPLRVSEHWTITPYTDTHFEAVAINGGNSDEAGSWTGDGNLSLNAGAEVVYQDADTYARLHAHTQLTLGLADIRGLLGSTVGVYTNYTEIGLEASQLVSAEARLNAAILCSIREYGSTCGGSVGATIDDGVNTHTFNAGVTGPVTTASQPWMPGGARTSLQLSYEYARRIDEHTTVGASLGYTQSLVDTNFMVNGGLALHWY